MTFITCEPLSARSSFGTIPSDLLECKFLFKTDSVTYFDFPCLTISSLFHLNNVKHDHFSFAFSFLCSVCFCVTLSYFSAAKPRWSAYNISSLVRVLAHSHWRFWTLSQWNVSLSPSQGWICCGILVWLFFFLLFNLKLFFLPLLCSKPSYWNVRYSLCRNVLFPKDSLLGFREMRDFRPVPSGWAIGF